MSSTTDPWGWGPAWRKLRDDVNVLGWLFEEERELTRLYVESVFWALTGRSFTVDEFAAEVGFGSAAQGAPDDPQRPAQGALDPGGQGQDRDRDAHCRCGCKCRDEKN